MRILTVSDTVVSDFKDPVDPELLKGVDLVLSCGDLPPEYLASLATRTGAPLYYVLGNHDIRHRGPMPAGCLNLHGRVLEYGGLRFLGLEGSRWYNGGPNQYPEKEMQRMVRGLRAPIRRAGGVDIVITHAPPRHIHDAEDPCHMGFESFLTLIDLYEPLYFIHGHIHKVFKRPADRITTLNRTKVINTYGFYLLDIASETRHG
jgi:uncharacterized protein